MTGARFWSAAGAAATLALVFLPTPAVERPRAATPPGPYVVTDLGTFGTVQSAQAYDIKEAGQVVGTAASHPFLWQDGVMTDLTTVAGNRGHAVAIKSGRIVGSSTLTPTSSTARPVLWENGTMIDLAPDLPGNEGGSANSINEAGQVVGTINYWVPFLWQNGVRTNLGHLGGGGGFANDINGAGQIVGASYTTEVGELGPIAHAVLWEGGVAKDLGLLEGDEDGGAAAINTPEGD